MCGDFVTPSRLLDGSEVIVRRLQPADYDAVIRLASGLTSEENYQRFFTAHPTFIGEWALSLTAPAPGIVAVGAFECDELIGVSNYAELPQPGNAEIAVVVAHEQHDRGVGTLLLEAVGRIAHDAGVHRFVADVLTDNSSMRHLINDSRWPVTQHSDRAVVAIELDLDDLGTASHERGPV